MAGGASMPLEASFTSVVVGGVRSATGLVRRRLAALGERHVGSISCLSIVSPAANLPKRVHGGDRGGRAAGLEGGGVKRGGSL